MRSRAVLLPVLALSSATLLSGCGGGKATQTTKPTTTHALVSTSETEAQIKRNWEEFFNGTTSTEKRVKLLQNGDSFASLLKTVDSFSLAKQVKATVSKVKLNGADNATVTYTVLLGGQPVLKNATGTAVREGNDWKVGTASFCALVKLEGASPKACSAAK